MEQDPMNISPNSLHTTHWSLVRRAVDEHSPEAPKAMEAICAAYWYPVYAFIRHSGKSPHDAEDLTQGFFARVLEKELFAAADEQKGRLRTFLFTCLRRFLADEHDRDIAEKRGYGRVISLDAMDAEERFHREPVDRLSPDRLFQRRWALMLLDASLRTLGELYATEGKEALFLALRPFLGVGAVGPQPSIEALSAQLAMPAGTVKSHVSRLRERWREVLLESVAATLDEPTSDDIKGELAELLECL